MAFVSLVAVAVSAFQAPAARVAPRSSVSMMAKSKALPFLEAPPAIEGLVGSVGFDPLKCSQYVDTKWLVESEIKHGRICMLATAGWIATDVGFHLPGEAYNVPPLLAHDAMVDKGDMLILFLAASLFEILGGTPKIFQLFNLERSSQPGDYFFDPLHLANDKMRLSEIRNGRLAMLAFSGIVTQSALYGQHFPYY